MNRTATSNFAVSRRAILGTSARRVMAAGVLLLVVIASVAEAQQRPSAGRRASPRRRQLIRHIQQQVSAAQRVLAAAESQSAMSQRQLDEAAQKLSSIRGALEAERANAQDAAKALRAIEAEIVAAQPPDSEFGRAQAAVAEAKKALNRELCRVVPGASAVKFTESQKAALENDLDYRSARRAFETAARELDRVRQRLFRADEEWMAARRDSIDAEKNTRQQKQQATTTGLGSLSNKQDLRTARGIAAAARNVIAFGEARLRQSGAQPRSPGESLSGKRK